MRQVSSQVLQRDSLEAVDLNLPTVISLVSSEIREKSLSYRRQTFVYDGLSSNLLVLSA